MTTFQVEMLWRCSTCQTEMKGRYKKCSNCGKPKDTEPFYDAPGPVTRADAVTDPALLKQAKAGPDWHCAYCGCAERRDSGECLNCGSPSGDSIRPTTRTSPPARARATTPKAQARVATRGAVFKATRAHWPMLLWGLGFVVSALLLWFALSPTELKASVASREWKHTVHVERYQVVADEGFHEDQPSDAFDVEHEGSRIHHHDRVPDGYRTESYQESYSCGETCYTTPVNCTSNQNGFKTCSGGNRSCSPKTCYRTAYRQVPKYRDVPVYRGWYRWHVWRWRHHRDVTEHGAGGNTRWPSAEKIALGKKERTKREVAYRVFFADVDGERHTYEPKTLAEYQGLTEGKTELLSVGLGSVSIVREAR